MKFYAMYKGKKRFAGIGKLVNNGPVISIYDDLEKARQSAQRLHKRFQQPFLYKELNDLFGDLHDLSKQGFAGALLNDSLTLQFLEDKHNTLFIVKYNQHGQLQDMLQEDGTWTKIPPDAALRPLSNYRKIDGLLKQVLDGVPYWGFRPGQTLYFLQHQASGQLCVIPDMLGQGGKKLVNCPLFAHNQFAQEAIKYVLHDSENSGTGSTEDDQLAIKPVADIAEFVAAQADHLCGVLLNPFSHRCMQGRFYVEQKALYLETYSGFWQCIDNGDLQRLRSPGKTDRMLDSTFYFWTHDDWFNVPPPAPPMATEDEDRSILALNISLKHLDIEYLKSMTDVKNLKIIIDKNTVEQQQVSKLGDTFRAIVTQGLALRFKDNVAFQFSGYKDSQQAPFEIEPIRTWYQSLKETMPYLVYFLEAEGKQIRTAILSTCPLDYTENEVAEEHESVSAQLFQEILEATMHGMRLAQMVDDDPAEVVQKVFDAFGIEPDHLIYEKMLTMIERADRAQQDGSPV